MDSPHTGTSRRLSAAAVRKKREKNRRNKRILSAFVIAAAVCALGYAVFDKAFVIRHFSVKGQESYTAEEAEMMAKSLGLEKGMHLFGFDREKAEQSARYILSSFDSVHIRYALPDGVVFEVKESEPALYVTVGGNYYILSPWLRVLGVTTDGEYVERLCLKRVLMNGITSCVAGNFVETANGEDEVLKQLYAVLAEEGCLADANDLDVSDRFALTFLYKQRFRVRLGDADNLSVKIRFMKSIAEKLSDTAVGEIDVSDENYREGMFKSY